MFGATLRRQGCRRVVAMGGRKEGLQVECLRRKKGSLNLLLLLELLLLEELVVVELVVGRGLLVLHVLLAEVDKVRLGLGELELVHTLAGVPVHEGLATVHGRELLADTLEERLDRGRVADEGRRHLEATGRNVTLRGSDVSGDPLDEVSRVLRLATVSFAQNW